MTDMFGEWVPNEWIAACFGVMAATPHHTHQILTKRAERLPKWFEWATFERINDAVRDVLGRDGVAVLPTQRHGMVPGGAWPLPSVHLGVSCEDQQRADERIPHLLATPAAVRWISAEPLLGPLDLRRWIAPISLCKSCHSEHPGSPEVCPRCQSDSLITLWGEHQLERALTGERYENGGPSEDEDGPQLHWIVVGGESGASARPFELPWGESLVEQCRDADVPLFFKQVGARPVHSAEPTGNFRTGPNGKRQYELSVVPLRINNRKGGDMLDWPPSLRVRQFPETLP